MKYRPEIDGLRAFAVVAVVIYHAVPSLLPGGFTGVDVFFVISGYLITLILLDELRSGHFSLLQFYGRRVRRIFPALILVMGASLVAGWFLLFADQYEQMARHIASGAVFLVNFVLVAEAGYFDAAAEAKPMLHLWSLAVEEQFYIFWPLLLWLGTKWRFSLVLLIVLVAAGSFALNLLFVATHPVETFFWPLGRFWELLCGSLLAWISLYRPRCLSPDHATEQARFLVIPSLMGGAGIILLLAGVLVIDSSKAFPGIWALIPVLGAVLVIAGGPEAATTRWVFMNRVAIWVGLISYPLYLWHWPLLAFLRIHNSGTPPYWQVAVVIVFALGLSWLTYRFVERPIRSLGAMRRMTLSLSVLLVALGLAGYTVKEADGFDQRVVRDGVTYRDLNQITERNHGLGRQCSPDESFSDPDCATGQAPEALLWGDSYAMHLAGALSTSPDAFTFRQQTLSSCRPVLDFAVLTETRTRSWAEDCIAHNDAVLQWLAKQPGITYVILGSPFTFFEDAIVEGRRTQVTEEVFVEKLRGTIDSLAAIGKKPVIVAPPPWSGRDQGECWRRAFLDGFKKDCSFERDTRTREVYNRLAALAKWAPVISLQDLICENDKCISVVNNIGLYADTGHLSRRGSEEFGRRHNLAALIRQEADAFWSK